MAALALAEACWETSEDMQTWTFEDKPEEMEVQTQS